MSRSPTRANSGRYDQLGTKTQLHRGYVNVFFDFRPAANYDFGAIRGRSRGQAWN